jgi:hypothetical protein
LKVYANLTHTTLFAANTMRKLLAPKAQLIFYIRHGILTKSQEKRIETRIETRLVRKLLAHIRNEL